MSRIKYYSDDQVIERFYESLVSGDPESIQRVHIPRSDVFYVRNALEAHLGERYSLDRVERAMYLEGFLDRRDVLDPDRKRDWED